MANPHRPTGWSLAATAAVILAAGATPAAASSGGASAPGADIPAAPAAAGLMPSGGALAAMPLKPDTIQAPVGGALVGAVTIVHGELTMRDANRPVLLEYFDARRGWEVAASGRTNPVGAFAVALRPTHIGRFMFRATTAQAATAATTAATPTTPIEIYRPVVATIFGPGSYGSRTACGQILTPQLLGVAHLTLPCGTLVDITYANKTITVPVVDRGPYVGGVSYDLTTATAAALGIADTAHIGALAIRGATPAAG
jgi:peptidoglycan lytic transglycosylase